MTEYNENIWGIDLGDVKIEGVILRSADDPEVICRASIPTEADKGYNQVLKQVVNLVVQMALEVNYLPDSIGICTTGALEPSSGLMKNSNVMCINDKAMKKDLESNLKMSVTIANYANCFALAETKLGIVKKNYPKARVVFGIILGTGVGGGIVVNEKVSSDYHGVGGEWGHSYLNEIDGRACYCGKIGCNESILSEPALERYYYELSGKKKSLPEIVNSARLQADLWACNTIQRLTNYFGLALSGIASILDPDVIVIGGGVGNIDEIYEEGVSNIQKYVFNNTFSTPVVKPLLGDSAGVFGAAFLVNVRGN